MWVGVEPPKPPRVITLPPCHQLPFHSSAVVVKITEDTRSDEVTYKVTDVFPDFEAQSVFLRLKIV